METTLPTILVMYLVPPDGPMGAADAFEKLEAAIQRNFKGRKFYGTMFNGEYRACLALREDDDPKTLGFPTWTIPGGTYYREKVTDWEKHLTEIAPKFEEIKNRVNVDETRPLIEFYRSEKELYLLVPIH